MYKGLRLLPGLFFIMIVLSGCMFPEDEKVQNQIPYEDQLQSVQRAIDQYKEASGGLLPIKTKDELTPIYQKYPIDFKKIVPQYMAEPPSNAFESGGVFQYVLINVEQDPEVKLIDLRMSEAIRDIKMRMNSGGYPPYKEQVSENVFTLDFTKLGYQDEPFVESPFTGQNLSFVVTGDAQIYVDYRQDLYLSMQGKEVDYQTGEDIRDILMENSPFVPAYSLPYTLDSETNEPIFFVK